MAIEYPTFEEYLATKKIDAEKLKENDEKKFLELDDAFAVMNPKSFTNQYLFLFNNFRKLYPLNI